MTTSETSARRTAKLSAARGAVGTVCALLALAAALTGCGSDSDNDAGAPAPAAPSRSAEPSPSSSPSPTMTKSMKPSTPAEPRACVDGSCTVVVTKGTEIPPVDLARHVDNILETDGSFEKKDQAGPVLLFQAPSWTALAARVRPLPEPIRRKPLLPCLELLGRVVTSQLSLPLDQAANRK